MLENYWEDARNNIFQAEEKYSMARLMFSACSFLIIKRSKDLFLFPNLLTHWKIDNNISQYWKKIYFQNFQIISFSRITLEYKI